jgi:hypothetical protein
VEDLRGRKLEALHECLIDGAYFSVGVAQNERGGMGAERGRKRAFEDRTIANVRRSPANENDHTFDCFDLGVVVDDADSSILHLDWSAKSRVDPIANGERKAAGGRRGDCISDVLAIILIDQVEV